VPYAHVCPLVNDWEIFDMEVVEYAKMPIPAPTMTYEDKIEELRGAALTSPIFEASSRDDFGYIVHHASGKQLLKEQITEFEGLHIILFNRFVVILIIIIIICMFF
ncbi:hypothetical protein ACJX0J_029958, partial [Zea mays]